MRNPRSKTIGEETTEDKKQSETGDRKEDEAVEDHPKPKRNAKRTAPEGDIAEAAPEAQPRRSKRTKKGADLEEKKEGEKSNARSILKIGDLLPADLDVLNDRNEKVNIRDLVKENGIVLFMYPRANTPGCTKQALGFKDNFDKLQKAGYTVYGLSGDKPAAQSKWKEKSDFPYDLLSDLELKVVDAFGARKSPKSIIRSHVIISKGGKVEDAQIKISPADSVERACAYVISK